MRKETRQLIAVGLLPLVTAVAALVNAYAKNVEAEAALKQAQEAREEKFRLSDSFQEYIEYVMRQRGCEP